MTERVGVIARIRRWRLVAKAMISSKQNVGALEVGQSSKREDAA